MQTSSFVEAIERFYLDLVGLLVPGGVLVLGLWFLWGQPNTLGSMSLNSIDSNGVLLILLLAYISGHLCASIGERLILPIVDRIPFVKSRPQIAVDIGNSQVFIRAVEQMQSVYPQLNLGEKPNKNNREVSRYVRDWRNYAITIIQENDEIFYRFMAISQLNLGIASAFISLSVIGLLFNLLQRLNVQTPLPPSLLACGTIIVLSGFFLERQQEFYRRSISLPFSLVTVKLTDHNTRQEPKTNRIEGEI
jgi:hypothetical protein